MSPREAGRMRRLPHALLVASLVAVSLAWPHVALAGPPFVTDDPEPVGYRHWEVYLAAQGASDATGWSGIGPSVEVNYGAVPDVQLHVIASTAWSAPAHAGAQLGFGDVELGVKYRFVHESDDAPQVGTFPLVELPTGDAARGLGSGHTQVFLPLWLQKSWGPWTTYGGVGYWFVDGPHELSRWFVGWQAQVRLASWITLGAEAFAEVTGQSVEPGFDLGGMIDIGDLHHILFSVGGRYGETLEPQAYVAYQLTFGPAT